MPCRSHLPLPAATALAALISARDTQARYEMSGDIDTLRWAGEQVTAAEAALTAASVDLRTVGPMTALEAQQVLSVARIAAHGRKVERILRLRDLVTWNRGTAAGDRYAQQLQDAEAGADVADARVRRFFDSERPVMRVAA